MTDTPIKFPHYVLIVDRKTDAILSTMLQAVTVVPSAFNVFHKLLESEGVTNEELMSYLDENSNKSHSLGWCEDKECEWVAPKGV